MNAAQAYAAAVDALAAARRARQDALRLCENYEAGEAPDNRYPGSPGYAACFWDGERARADWCEACAARTDLGDWKALKREKARAQAEVLRAGRAGSEADTVTRTSVALVKARDEVKWLRREMAALRCIYEIGPIGEHGMHTDPVRRSYCYPTTKSRGVWEEPCWKLTPADQLGEYPDAIGDVSDEGWCPACEAREALRKLLIPARRHAGAIERGHLAATRAHMRRTVLATGRTIAKAPRATSTLETLAIRLGACDRERATVTNERNAIECEQAARDRGEGPEPEGPCPWGGEPPEWAAEDFTAPRNLQDGHGGWIQPCWTRTIEEITDSCPGGMYHQQDTTVSRVPIEECCPSCQRRVGLTHDLHTLNRRRAALISLIARHPDTGAPPRQPRQPKPRRPAWTPTPAPYPQPERKEGPDDDLPF